MSAWERTAGALCTAAILASGSCEPLATGSSGDGPIASMASARSAVEVRQIAPSAAATPATPSAHAGPRVRIATHRIKPLQAGGPPTRLAVPGFRDAALALPLGADTPRPLVVALHGNFDRPEWQCQVWAQVTRGYPIVVCPRGVPRADVSKKLDRWTYSTASATGNELDAAVAAARARFGQHIATGPVVLIGFSLGAILAVPLLRERAEEFPAVVLVEGGAKAWASWGARAFAKAGGRRVLFACGQYSCRSAARKAARRLERHGIDARVVFGGNTGHTYDGAVADEVAAQWGWLVDGIAGWPGWKGAGRLGGL